MELHNTVEDSIISRVNEVFSDIKNEKNPGNHCLCEQCRMDIICYVLNRTPPYYIVSNRGVARVRLETIEHQQRIADITTLIYEGLKRINHNQRPNFSHSGGENVSISDKNLPVFNIPTIIGRLFNGNNFAPLLEADVELLRDGVLVPMKDGNWQNPCHLVTHTEGNFSFWPAVVTAPQIDEHKFFEYTLKVSAPEFETLTHFFTIPVASEVQASASFTLKRTFKLPDLYMFHPGEAEQNG